MKQKREPLRIMKKSEIGIPVIMQFYAKYEALIAVERPADMLNPRRQSGFGFPFFVLNRVCAPVKRQHQKIHAQAQSHNGNPGASKSIDQCKNQFKEHFQGPNDEIEEHCQKGHVALSPSHRKQPDLSQYTPAAIQCEV